MAVTGAVWPRFRRHPHHTVLGRLPRDAGGALGWFARDKTLNVKVLRGRALALAAEVSMAGGSEQAWRLPEVNASRHSRSFSDLNALRRPPSRERPAAFPPFMASLGPVIEIL